MYLKILLNSIVGLILILVWLQFVNIREIFAALSKINPLSVAPVFVFMFLSAFLRALRLKVFLAEIKKIPLKDLVLLNGFAMMLNFLIPIRAGEVAKGVYLNLRFGLKLGKAIIWIFLDRFVDFLVVLIAAGILFFLIPTALNITFITIITVIFFIALLLAYLAIFQRDFTQKIISFLMHLLIFNRIKIYFERFSKFILDSFSVLKRHPRDLMLMTAVTVLAYGADGAIWYFAFQALGSGQNFAAMYLGQLLSALTYLIPAAPGYVGSAEASGLLILSGVLGVKVNLASAIRACICFKFKN
ncbi:flippase-like domain-containing protein [Candidatus Daviesbacteria bacterium]|nr:flippase-like domain-containing protein [Candidatus Daviesbacteria bacterium]